MVYREISRISSEVNQNIQGYTSDPLKHDNIYQRFTMSKIRPAAVAGLFYPADPAQLHNDIQTMLSVTEQTESVPKA